MARIATHSMNARTTRRAALFMIGFTDACARPAKTPPNFWTFSNPCLAGRSGPVVQIIFGKGERSRQPWRLRNRQQNQGSSGASPSLALPKYRSQDLGNSSPRCALPRHDRAFFLFSGDRISYGLTSLVKKQLPSGQKKPSVSSGRRKVHEGLPIAKPVGTSRKATLRDLFGIDARSLAMFRMVMGALLLVELAIRVTDLNVMYTDAGMFPRAEICRRATTIWNWSFHFGSGSWGYQALLFGMAAGLALALMIGFETRLAAIGSWLMLVSIHHRVPPILSGAEVLLRMLLFWALFLPLGRVWSVDSWQEKRRGIAPSDSVQTQVLSVASAAILLQMGLMYFFSAIYKSNAEWLRGEALAGILAHDFYASPPAAYLLPFPRLLTGMTWATFVLEWAAPFILFFPRSTARLRLGVMAALAAMHLGIGLCLEVGLFSYVSLAGLTLFLPGTFWNNPLFARFSRPAEVSKPLVDAAKHVKRPPLFYAWQGACLMLLLYVFAVNINSF